MKIGELIVQLGTDNTDLAKGLKKARSDVEVFMLGVNKVSAAMATVGAASAGAMVGAVNSARSWAAAVNDLEDKTDMSGESASRLLYITQAVGLEMNTAGDSLAKMSRTITMAAQQQEQANAAGREATDVFTRYGIAIHDANGKLLSAEQIFQNITEKHRVMANGIEKTSMEMEIFGKSGAKLNDLLNLSADQMAEMTKRAERQGLVLNHDTTQAWEDLEFQLNESKLAMKGVAVQIGNALLPQVQALSQNISELGAWFSGLTKEEQSTIVATIETGAVVGALGLGIRALTFTFGPLVDALKTAKAWMDAFKLSAISAKAAALGVIGIVGGAIAYGAYEKYEAYKKYGVDAFTYSPDGEIRLNHDYIAQKEAEKSQQTQQQVIDDVPNPQDVSGTSFGGGGGVSADIGKAKRKAEREAEQLQRKIDSVTESIKRSAETTTQLADGFKEAGIELQLGLLDGADKVFAELSHNKDKDIKDLDDYAKQYKKAIEEAEKIKKDAEETKDTETIAKANAFLQEQINNEVKAAEEIARRKLLIEDNYEKERSSKRLQAQALNAELQAALDESDSARYMQVLNDENVAFLNHLEEQRQALEQYHEWRMEAEQTYANFKLQMAEEFKSSVSDGLTDFIMGTKSLGQALQETMQQMVQMYIKWRIQKALAGVFAKTEQAKETAFGIANASALASAWWAAAVPKMIATGGMGGFAGLGNLSRGIGGGGWGVPFLAEGGMAYAPTLAMIGEGRHKEAVLPLSENTFGEIAKGIASQGIKGNTTINVSTLDSASFESFLERSGSSLKRYLDDSAREFSVEGSAFA